MQLILLSTKIPINWLNLIAVHVAEFERLCLQWHIIRVRSKKKKKSPE